VTSAGVPPFASAGTLAPSKRPALADVLGRIGRGDVLVVSRVDRLARSTWETLGLVDRAGREGWSLVALDLCIDTSTPSGRMVLTVIAAVAEMERQMIAQRTRDALAEKKAAGYRMGRPVELPAEVRERIGRDRAAGVSLAGIVDALTAEGVATARGGRWTRSAVQKVCRSLALDAHAEAIRAAAEVAA
jgi:DNA invertase Pin-like site-specific DNA recombinase